jgi:tetratricopeptide (TPR) repeat protein
MVREQPRFRDNNDDQSIRKKKDEIYADAETAFLYAVGISRRSGLYTEGSLEPLVSLGTLHLDAGRREEAKERIDSALKIRPGYPPALAALQAYYAAIGKPQMAVGLKATAKANPTTVGKAFNEIIRKTDDVPSRGKDLPTEEAHETYLEELIKVDSVTYADVFGGVDPQTAKETRDSARKLNEKMKITIPNITILTQYTTVNKDNYIAVYGAIKAVENDMKIMERYAKKYRSDNTNFAADFFEKIGVTARVKGKAYPDYLRDVAKNPDGGSDGGKDEDRAYADIMKNMMSFAKDMSDGITKVNSKDFGKEDVNKLYKTVGKIDPLIVVQGINPFDYANSWDVLIQ